MKKGSGKYYKLDKEIIESEDNLLKFFELLLKVDMRNNPNLYKKKNK